MLRIAGRDVYGLELEEVRSLVRSAGRSLALEVHRADSGGSGEGERDAALSSVSRSGTREQRAARGCAPRKAKSPARAQSSTLAEPSFAAFETTFDDDFATLGASEVAAAAAAAAVAEQGGTCDAARVFDELQVCLPSPGFASHASTCT